MEPFNQFLQSSEPLESIWNLDLIRATAAQIKADWDL